jgi:hypothetical protein
LTDKKYKALACWVDPSIQCISRLLQSAEVHWPERCKPFYFKSKDILDQKPVCIVPWQEHIPYLSSPNPSLLITVSSRRHYLYNSCHSLFQLDNRRDVW